MKTLYEGQSLRSHGANQPSTSYAQGSSARARYILLNPEEQGLGKPFPGILT